MWKGVGKDDNKFVSLNACKYAKFTLLLLLLLFNGLGA